MHVMQHPDIRYKTANNSVLKKTKCHAHKKHRRPQFIIADLRLLDIRNFIFIGERVNGARGMLYKTPFR